MPPRREKRVPAGLFHAVILLLVLVVGCRTSPPQKPAPPPFEVTVTHFAGSPLTGPDDVEELGEMAEFRGVLVSFSALPELPLDRFDPAASRARLILASGETIEMLPTLVLSRGARFGDGPDVNLPLAGATEFGDMDGVVAPGLTAQFTVTGRGPSPKTEGSARIQVNIHQAYVSRAFSLTFTMREAVADEARAIPREESATFPLCTEGGMAAVIILPSVFASGGKAIAARIQVGAKSDPDAPGAEAFHARVLDSLTEAAQAFARARARAVPMTPHAMVEQAMLLAIDAAEEVDGGRRTLLYLAQTTEASFAEDLVLLGPESVFLTFRQAVTVDLAKQKGAANPTEIGWIIESAACRAALQGYARGEVGPDFAAAVIRRAGEVGNHAGLFADLAEQSHSLADFQRLLLAENFAFLLDAEPASRVWAYDWLEEHGRAPPGYDPLGDKKERKAALLAAAREGESKP